MNILLTRYIDLLNDLFIWQSEDPFIFINATGFKMFDVDKEHMNIAIGSNRPGYKTVKFYINVLADKYVVFTDDSFFVHSAHRYKNKDNFLKFLKKEI